MSLPMMMRYLEGGNDGEALRLPPDILRSIAGGMRMGSEMR